MAFYHYQNYYKELMRQGRLPVPYPYLHQSAAPNLCNNSNSCYYPNINDINCQQDYLIRPNIYDQTPYQNPSTVQSFVAPRLIANVPDDAKIVDPNLLNPWGILIMDDIIWVADSGAGLITSYDLLGNSYLTPINVFGPFGNIAEPTGIALNASLDAFKITNGPLIQSSSILVATRNGTINGFNTIVDPINTIIMIDNGNLNAVYTGLAVVNLINNVVIRRPRRLANNFRDQRSIEQIGSNVLYATDFFNREIVSYDGQLNKLNYLFVDEYSEDPIPQNYAPYNIINIGDYLYVVYAEQRADDNQYVQLGVGNGYISIFDFKGNFVRRFVSRNVLNAPWGVALSPSYFGYPAGSVMVGNNGDGLVNVFSEGGSYLGTLSDASMNQICLGNLFGLFVNPNYNELLYWASSRDNLRISNVGTVNSLNYRENIYI